MGLAKARVPLKITKQGDVYLWESGGKMKDRISSTIIADSEQMKKRPLASRVSETRDGFKYGKVPIEIGDIIVRVNSDMNFNLIICIYKVDNITEDFVIYKGHAGNRPVAECTVIDYFNNYKWNSEDYKSYEQLIKLALIQATRFSSDAIYIDYN